jgi:Sec-independent protein translocase protein TatA
MHAFSPVAFLNLGLPETVVIGVVALLLFGPRLGRMIGQFGGTVMKFKSDVENTKHGFTRAIEREMDSALRGRPERPRQAHPPKATPEREAEDDAAAS